MSSWSDVKTSIERGLNSARKEDQHAMRVHCRAGHRIASHVKGRSSKKEVVDELHRASRSIDLSAAIKHMEAAMVHVERELGSA